MECVRAGLYRDYADTFEQHLVNDLQYRTPQLLVKELVDVCGGTAASWSSVIDLGYAVPHQEGTASFVCI